MPMAKPDYSKELYVGEIALAEVLREASAEWIARDRNDDIEEARLGAFQYQARKVLEYQHGDRR